LHGYQTYYSDASVRWNKNLNETSGATNSATATRYKVLAEKMKALLESKMEEDGIGRDAALLWVTEEMIRVYGRNKQTAYQKIVKEKKDSAAEAK